MRTTRTFHHQLGAGSLDRFTSLLAGALDILIFAFRGRRFLRWGIILVLGRESRSKDDVVRNYLEAEGKNETPQHKNFGKNSKTSRKYNLL